MGWLQDIRNKSRAERIKLIWIISGVTLVVLVIAWALIGNFNYETSKDQTLFKALQDGFNNIRNIEF